MFWLPHRAFTIETALPPAAVLDRLRGATAPRRWLRASGEHRPFEGVVEGGRFDVQRVIQYRNSFLPRVRGTVEPTATGSRLAGTMRLHGFTAAFMIVWLAAVTVACVKIVPEAFAGGRFAPGPLVPAGMLVFGVALTLGGFIPEARKALRELAALVDASHSTLR